jgi:TonB family protein
MSASPRIARDTSGKTSGAPSGRGKGSGSAGTGMSNAARIAAGHMPSPDYPPYSRRNRQEGTVVVEFTVDSSGKVISAYAKHPCQWNLLNTEAVSTVRSWRFPPGGVMTLQRPIVFQLR